MQAPEDVHRSCLGRQPKLERVFKPLPRLFYIVEIANVYRKPSRALQAID